MDGTWVYPMEDSEEESGREALAQISEDSAYLVLFLEPERKLALTAASELGSHFRVDDRGYRAMDEVVVFDWMTDAQGRLVGVRNLLPPEKLVSAFESEKWPWVTHEDDELRLWFGHERQAELSQTVQRCVFGDPFRSEDGRLALAYDCYALQPEEVERLSKIQGRWVRIASG